MKHVAMTIELQEDVWEWLKMEAIRQRKPSVAIIREALEDYREKKESEA